VQNEIKAQNTSISNYNTQLSSSVQNEIKAQNASISNYNTQLSSSIQNYLNSLASKVEDENEPQPSVSVNLSVSGSHTIEELLTGGSGAEGTSNSNSSSNSSSGQGSLNVFGLFSVGGGGGGSGSKTSSTTTETIIPSSTAAAGEQNALTQNISATITGYSAANVSKWLKELLGQATTAEKANVGEALISPTVTNMGGGVGWITNYNSPAGNGYNNPVTIQSVFGGGASKVPTRGIHPISKSDSDKVKKDQEE
jgi:hypothetical protein